MNNEKIKPGDVLFDGQLKEYPVERVGNKFAYVREYHSYDVFMIQKIQLHNLTYQDYRGAYVKLYRDKQTASDENEAAKLFDLIRNRISQYYSYESANLTPAQLRQIAEVLGGLNALTFH
jgi:hypothetical protein